jgi:hypothetical protein
MSKQDFPSRFLKLQTFLSSYESLWSKEIINDYPESMLSYPEEWIEQLSVFTDEKLWEMENQRFAHLPSRLPKGSELAQYFLELNYFCQWEKRPQEVEFDFPSWAFFKVSEKKQHEIKRILSTLTQIYEKEEIQHMIDIGGGVGHMARVAALYFGIPFHSLDTNQDFQDLGVKRLEKYPPPIGAASLSFHHLEFGSKKDYCEKKLKEIFTSNSFTVGLHTCGPLAIEHIKESLKYQTKGLINFGCCYNKLSPETDVNLSQFSKAHKKFSLNKYALTLATRAHCEERFEDYQNKKKVKNYRYALHLYLQEKGLTQFVSVGSSPLSIYKLPFSQYAEKKLKSLGLDFSEKELESFYKKESIQKMIQRLFIANMIRCQLGRPLELFILIDRCLWIEEQGLQVSLLEYFEEKKSPRNLGILVTQSH